MAYMSNEQAKAYNKIVDESTSKLNISDFEDASNRTLTIGVLYGEYDSILHVHIYIKDEEINVAYYGEPSHNATVRFSDHVSGKELPVTHLSPVDGCFPWATDIEFAELMLAKNEPLSLMDSTYSKPPRMANGYLGGIVA